MNVLNAKSMMSSSFSEFRFVEHQAPSNGEANRAVRFGDLLPFGLLFEPFGDQYFDLAILKFGSFLGYF